MTKLVNSLSDGNIQTTSLIQSIVYRIKVVSDNPSVRRDYLTSILGDWLEKSRKYYKIHKYSVSVSDLLNVQIIIQPTGLVQSSILFEVDIFQPVNSCVRFPSLGNEFVDIFNVRFIESDSYVWSLSYENEELKFDPKKYF